MHIVFVTSNYPTPSRPESGTFVQQFVWAMARQGNKCSVINPTSVFDRRYGPYPPRFTAESAVGGSTVHVHRPLFVTFSSRNLGFTHTGRWTQRSFNFVVSRQLKALPVQPDLVYGHFLYAAGYAALRSGQLLKCPAVVGVGESSLWTLDAYGEKRARVHFANGAYFLSNSTPNRGLLVQHMGIEPERIFLEPNGVDLNVMCPGARESMRKKYGIAGEGFTIAFVGSNEERKGPMRLLAAIDGLQGVQCIFAGAGTQNLASSYIVRKGTCGHGDIPELLSCADVFVLPTTNEGSCNAVIEAMACGLPIITSNGRYMDDIVDDDVAIRVDPLDVREIREAILALKNNPERRKSMSEACLKKARGFDINERARRVTAWMAQLIDTA